MECFNEAAIKGSRKYHRRNCYHRDMSSFNEAAIKGPRKSSWCIASNSRAFVLQ